MKNKFSSSVLHEGYIYGLDEAILACIDAETGELKWKGGRYGYGQVLLAGGNLIVTTESGDIAMVEATPERHHELAAIPAISGKTWNVPALADGICWSAMRRRWPVSNRRSVLLALLIRPRRSRWRHDAAHSHVAHKVAVDLVVMHHQVKEGGADRR